MRDYSVLIRIKSRLTRIRLQARDIMAAILYACITYRISKIDIVSCMEVRSESEDRHG